MDENRYYNLERMYFAPNVQKSRADLKRERFVFLLVLTLVITVVLGLPTFINLGKILFEIQPIIY